MTSWRDQASQTVQDQMDSLLDAALGVAEEELTGQGQLPPLAVVLLADGQMEARGAAIDGASATDQIEALREGLSHDKAALQAAALIYDVTIDGGDAIQVELEHADPAAPALAMALPYQRGWRNRVTFGDLRAAPGARWIWR